MSLPTWKRLGLWVLAAMAFAECSTNPQAPAGPQSSARQQVLAEFAGFVDVQKGQVKVLTVRPSERAKLDDVVKRFDALSELNVVQDGQADSGPDESVELVTAGLGSGAAACGRASSFCGTVTLRSFYTTQAIRGAFVELTAMTPSTGNTAFGDAPSGYTLSGMYGLWRYGNLGVKGSGTAAVTRSWKFDNYSGTNFTIRGRVLGDLQPNGATAEVCDSGGDEDGDGDTNCADTECATDTVLCVTTEDACGDQADDDGDAKVDCADPDCGASVACDCVAPPAGLVSWWTGDTGAEDIVGPNAGSLNGVTLAPGMVGNAFVLDGSDYVSAPSVGLPTGSADRTIELWGRQDVNASDTNLQTFVQYGTLGAFTQAWVLFTWGAGNSYQFSQWGASIAGGSLSLMTWHHLAVTEVGNFATVYVDGVAAGSGPIVISTSSGSTFVIGGVGSAPDGNWERLTGMVDEVSVYDRALSSSEIAAIFNAGSAGKCK